LVAAAVAALLVAAAGNTALQSVMPAIGREIGISDFWVAVAYTWSAVLWVALAPYWAEKSDHHGRKALTLLGLAGFILSIGMAVDANILIFERTKEELRNGRTLIPSVEAGFERAWSSIRDSNVSTLITCVILYWMGDAFASSLIKGFALTLAIGVIISMFSAIVITRSFMRMAVATPLRRWISLWTDDKPDPVAAQPVAAMPGTEAADA